MKMRFALPFVFSIIAAFVVGAYMYTHNSSEVPLPASSVGTIQGEANPPDASPSVTPVPQSLESDAQLQARMAGKFGSSAQITIRYHDQKTVAYIGFPSEKFPELIIADIDTLKQISTRRLLMWGATTTAHHIIGVSSSDTNILEYYKDGATDVVVVPNSKLPSSETYVKTYGMMDDYDFSFDETTKTLTASVFKPHSGPGTYGPNKKIRTVTFVLP